MSVEDSQVSVPPGLASGRGAVDAGATTLLIPPVTVLLPLAPTWLVDVLFAVVALVRPVVAVPPPTAAVVAVVLSVVSPPVVEVVAAGSSVVSVSKPWVWLDPPLSDPPPHAAITIPATLTAATVRQ
jgi:hypothetical protein